MQKWPFIAIESSAQKTCPVEAAPDRRYMRLWNGRQPWEWAHLHTSSACPQPLAAADCGDREREWEAGIQDKITWMDCGRKQTRTTKFVSDGWEDSQHINTCSWVCVNFLLCKWLIMIYNTKNNLLVLIYWSFTHLSSMEWQGPWSIGQLYCVCTCIPSHTAG